MLIAGAPSVGEGRVLGEILGNDEFKTAKHTPSAELLCLYYLPGRHHFFPKLNYKILLGIV